MVAVVTASGTAARTFKHGCLSILTHLLEFSPMRCSHVLAAAMAIFLFKANTVHAGDAQVARGKYLVQLGGCNDCHTPGYFLGKPDISRYLSGSDVGLEVPGLGVFIAPNLTSDKDTGLGNWTGPQIVTAIRTGLRPDGRMLAPIMPWRSFAALTDADAQAIAAYLKGLPPVTHKVPGPFTSAEKTPVPRMTVLPPTADAAQH
jgi:mono/diheme cytochrome c family protein